MSGKVDMARNGAHRATQDSLPWLLNGTLGGAGLEAAQAHLQDCAACRADLAGLRRLREAGRLADPHCNPERALAQLLTRLDATAQTPPPTAAPAAPAPVSAPVHDAAGTSWRARARRAVNDPRWLRRALLAECCALAVFGVLLGVLLGPLFGPLMAGPGEAFDVWRALGPAPAVQGRAVVVFRPDTSEREVRRILRGSGARIVDGPTVTDAWVLALPEGAPAARLARLRAEPAVLLAAPLAVEGGP
jgi:hypothetical protein